jgi:hypothetical protein
MRTYRRLTTISPTACLQKAKDTRRKVFDLSPNILGLSSKIPREVVVFGTHEPTFPPTYLGAEKVGQTKRGEPDLRALVSHDAQPFGNTELGGEPPTGGEHSTPRQAPLCPALVQRLLTGLGRGVLRNVSPKPTLQRRAMPSSKEARRGVVRPQPCPLGDPDHRSFSHDASAVLEP